MPRVPKSRNINESCINLEFTRMVRKPKAQVVEEEESEQALCNHGDYLAVYEQESGDNFTVVLVDSI